MGSREPVPVLPVMLQDSSRGRAVQAENRRLSQEISRLEEERKSLEKEEGALLAQERSIEEAIRREEQLMAEL